MQLNDFRRFSDTLVANLASDARVLGIVAMGSMAEHDYTPDQWSDHDFFVVTVPEAQEGVASADLSWLPNNDRLVYVAAEGTHGFRAIYDDGHIVEPTVLSVEELEKTMINRFRMLLDRGEIGQHVAKTQSAPLRKQVLLLPMIVLTSACFWSTWRSARDAFRAASGSVGTCFQELRHGTPGATTGALHTPSRPELVDILGASRRFERLYPEIAAEFDEIANLPPVDGALRLLELAEREDWLEEIPDFPRVPSKLSGSGRCGRPALSQSLLQAAP